jgi:hypothetical protein
VVLTVAFSRVPDAAKDPGTPLSDVPHFTGVGPADCDTSVPPHAAARSATRRTLVVRGEQDRTHMETVFTLRMTPGCPMQPAHRSTGRSDHAANG